MVNRIVRRCQIMVGPSEVIHFGSLRRLQPLYLPAPPCAVSKLLATEFLDLLRASISLDLLEKCHILQRLGGLSRHAIERLIEIMREEQATFRNLSDAHHAELRKHELKALTDWWRVEHWFWQRDQFEFEPRLLIGKADPTVPTNVEFLLQQIIWP